MQLRRRPPACHTIRMRIGLLQITARSRLLFYAVSKADGWVTLTVLG